MKKQKHEKYKTISMKLYNTKMYKHFFLSYLREKLKQRLVFLHELKIEVLLFGDDTLTEMQNLQIFKSVQLYI
jgi:hypothetical protein